MAKLFHADVAAKCSLPLSPESSSPDNFSTKRPALSDEEPDTPQKFRRRRASHACLSCRARKVRCNAADGVPCLNCRSDSIECVIQEPRRKRIRTNVTRSTCITNVADNANSCHAPIPTDPHRSPMSQEDTASATNEGSMLSSNDLDSDDQCAAGRFNDKDAVTFSRSWSSDTDLGSRWKDVDVNDATQFAAGPIPLFLKTMEFQDTIAQLPSFLRPLPANLLPEAVQYLHVMGALAVPAIPLQNALLQTYVEYINPCMPLMDLQNFLNIVYCRHGRNGQTSLLLFQSVMFAATAFVDVKYLREAGYKTRKEARKEFYQKIRLLYDFDYEQDGLAVVQTLIHMTYWDESASDQKHTWHWMSLAISFSQNIGLHRRSKYATMSSSEQRLRKRVWWSCVMRDRIIALSMRRPPMIADGDFDIPMLSESDFEIQELANTCNISQLDSTLMRDVNLQQELANVCIATAKLCISMGHMLQAQNSVSSGDGLMAKTIPNDHKWPAFTSRLGKTESVHALTSELNSWARSLPDCCLYQLINMSDIRDGRSTMAVQRTMLHLLHQSTIWVLYRPQSPNPLSSQGETTPLQGHEIAWQRAHEAAMKITQMVTELHQLQLDRFLPTTGVTIILPGIITHLLDMQNTSLQTRMYASRGLNQCMRVIGQLQEIYTVADSVAWFVNAALGKAPLGTALNAGQHIISLLQDELSAGVFAQISRSEHSAYKRAPKILVNKEMDLEGKSPTLLLSPTDPSNLALSTDSPVQYNHHLPKQTISAHSDSNEKLGDIDKSGLNIMQHCDDLGWIASAGIDLDAEHWLEFHEDDNLNADVICDENVGASNLMKELDKILDSGGDINRKPNDSITR